MALVDFTKQGLYCTQGDFYIDPWTPAKRCIITHAHSDHARPGSDAYLCHHQTVPLLQLRLGNHNYQGVEWEEKVMINGVRVSLHPAGHMIGSSQIRLEYKGEVWVISGDYKLEDDGLSGAFVPVPCHTFITESTFGLPIYHWKPQHEIFRDIQDWVCDQKKKAVVPVILAYSLGKAQRLLQCLPEVSPQIFVHGTIWNAHQALVASGFALPDVTRVDPGMSKETFRNGVVIAPSGADRTSWIKRFYPYSVAVCSGWMQVRGNVRRANIDAGFALSDHADWNGLLQAVKATKAEKVYVTHGFQSAFSRFLNETGIEAAEVETEFGNDEEGEIANEDPIT